MKVPLNIQLRHLGAKIVVVLGAFMFLGGILFAVEKEPRLWTSNAPLGTKLAITGFILAWILVVVLLWLFAFKTVRRINRDYFSKQPDRDEKPPG